MPSSARRSRLVVVAQAYPEGGGISGIVEMLVPELEREHEVHLALCQCGDGVSERLGLPPGRVHDLGLDRRFNPLLFPLSLAHATTMTRRLGRVVERIEPDLLIAQDAIHVGPVTVMTGRRTNVPTAVMDHGTLTNLFDPRWPAAMRAGIAPRKRVPFAMAFAANRPVREAAWRFAVRRATEVWFVGNELRPFFAAAGPRAKRYRQLIPSDFEPPSGTDVEAARRRFDIPSDARVVNVVTRLDSEKGLEDIAAAFARLLPRYRTTMAVVAGVGHLEADFRRWVADSGCADAVRFVGRLDRRALVELHKASDIHLYAGTVGCAVSIALLEAMQARVVPVIADVPTFHRELVTRSGFVFRAGDAADLERALEAALQLTPVELEQRKRLTRADLDAWTDPSIGERVAGILA